jgi:hypothetical protein
VARRAARDPHLTGERSVARAWAGSPALQLMGSEPAGRFEGLDQRRAAIEAQPGCEPVLQSDGEAGGLTARAGQPWSAPRPSQAHTTNKDTPCAHGGPGSHAERAPGDQRPSWNGPFAHDAVIPDCGDGATADVRPAKGVKRAAMAGRCASDEAVTTTCIRARSPRQTMLESCCWSMPQPVVVD